MLPGGHADGRHDGLLPGRLDALPIPATIARLAVSASVRPVARVHVPAQAWNATGAILRGRHVNPAIGIHKADDLDAVNQSTRQAIG